MDTTLSPPAGQLLDGRYLVESRLAHGGMATVYLGRDTRLDRTVAVKIAHPDLATDEEFIRRFMTEARAVAQLSSPNVVAVFDQGSARGRGAGGDINYIVMEYVAGPTLREVLRARGRLTVRESLDVTEGVLAGLATAHRAGIIHRDVKPENVLLGKDGAVKVADFGLARAAVAAASTKTGMIIGTAAYLAPEQVARSSSDARTDVYATGVMLFEMLTGQQPHTGSSPLAVAYKHVNEIVPPPSSLAPGLSPAVDALVAMATSRDPDLRPPDAAHFLQAVTEVRRGGQPSPSGRRGQHAAPGAPPAAASAPTAGLPAVPGRAGYDSGGHAAGDDTDLGPALARGGHRLAEDWQRSAGSGPYGAAGDATTAFAGQGGPRHGPGGSHRAGHGSGGAPGADSPNHTLVVSAGAIVPGLGEYDGERRGYHPGPYAEREPLLQRLLFSRRLLIVIGVVAAAAASVLLAWWVAAGQYTSVPQVAGFSQPLAKTELRGLGLTVRDGARYHSDTVPAGHVIRTVPRASSKISNGGAITLILSLGPVKVTVPQVTGEPLQQAVSTLRQAGLRVGTPVQAPSDTIPAGIVVSTSPSAGVSWPRHKPVTVTVSAGPPLPNFVGTALGTAQAEAQAGGYQINPVQAARSDQPQGTIIGQSPKAGTPISAGEVVTVQVSPGPPMVAIPDVQGEDVQQATQELKQAGFSVQVVQGFGPGTKVQNFSPQGQAPQGSTITLQIGLGF